DGGRGRSLLTCSLTNRIRGRTIALASAEPVRWELFRLTLGNGYDMRKREWTAAFASVIVSPTPTTHFRSDLTYDPRAGDFPSVTADVSADVPRGQLGIGIRYSDPPKTTLLH